MISIQIPNIKEITKMLFVGDKFDSFELSEAVFVTSGTFSIDGTINKEFYDRDEAILSQHILWADARPIAYSVIKGQKLPVSFRISFCASKQMIADVLENCPPSLNDLELIDSLSFNLIYKNRQLFATSAVTMKTFSLDQKTISHVWDKYLIAFLDYNEIEYEEI